MSTHKNTNTCQHTKEENTKTHKTNACQYTHTTTHNHTTHVLRTIEKIHEARDHKLSQRAHKRHEHTQTGLLTTTHTQNSRSAWTQTIAAQTRNTRAHKVRTSHRARTNHRSAHTKHTCTQLGLLTSTQKIHKAQSHKPSQRAHETYAHTSSFSPQYKKNFHEVRAHKPSQREHKTHVHTQAELPTRTVECRSHVNTHTQNVQQHKITEDTNARQHTQKKNTRITHTHKTIGRDDHPQHTHNTPSRPDCVPPQTFF